MFRKFFEACTITLGLYVCLQLSSVSLPSPVLWFKVSRFDPFSLSNVQEKVESNRWLTWRNQKHFNPRVNRY
ncbi:hypothetical protein [Crocosphaera subtropica]|uniref:hypothetical protein n=1 Tax=Crocosphaera subtropica TaxID=2546360 RepID=UPI0012EB433E|nr:hypothetical protein [Crocosphaera subtropica]